MLEYGSRGMAHKKSVTLYISFEKIDFTPPVSTGLEPKKIFNH